MPNVGVAGFLLGGGISTLSSRYGLGADMVLAWEVRKRPESNALSHVKSTADVSLDCYRVRKKGPRIA